MQRAAEGPIRIRNLMIGALIGLLAIVIAAVWGWDRAVARLCRPLVERAISAAGPSIPVPPPAEASAADPIALWQSRLGYVATWPEDLSSPAACAEIEQAVQSVCESLEGRDYIKGSRLEGGICELLRGAGEDLLRRPPEVSAEFRDPERLLGNVFHLFRVLGRERIDGLARIVVEERDLAEPLALISYRWLTSREACSGGGGPEGGVGLYAWASFFSETIGGQAYLRRRSPAVESLVCFWSLESLDRSIESGHNPSGIDPRREIARCQSLLGSQELVFADRYRNELERMSRRWQRRTSSPDGGQGL